MLQPLIICLLVFLNPSGTSSLNDEVVDLSRHFNAYGVEGCFTLLDGRSGKWYRYEPARCSERYIPKSTFKIPHALIALEEGILTDEHEIIPWDGTVYDIQGWNQDQDLASALKYSCVWFFSDLTEKIEGPVYRKYLEKFHYGNMEMEGPSSRYWLEGSLGISADEQVDFLRRFYSGSLGVSERSSNLVKEQILQEKTSGYSLYAKTGGGPINQSSTIMWYVGFVEKNDRVYYFALNFTCKTFNAETSAARTKITKSILKEMGIFG